MDVIQTSGGNLEVTFVGHGSLVFSCQGTVVHVDPWSQLADYTKLPKADLVLVTHEHRDHLDPAAIEAVRKPDTLVVVNAASAAQVPGSRVMGNGDVRTLQGLKVEAVPAYNIVHLRAEGQPYHPRGSGNGYVVTFGDQRVYVAGDTENIPEMKDLRDIACAFLPMNLPYTMTPEMVADAARTLAPRILYPYHYGETDPALLVALLEGAGIEVRIRDLR
ncbi:MAG: MBL fold metallo-hydrolase [Deferrisomatales bacterium]|nr:MBL fold metallo-hydrolase [Deferrisomatales bacterium]